MTGLLAINNHVEVLYDDDGQGDYYGATIERAGDLGWTIRWDDPGDGEPTREVPKGHIREFRAEEPEEEDTEMVTEADQQLAEALREFDQQGVEAAIAAGARAAVALDRLGNADTKKLFAVPKAQRLRATPCVELVVQQLVVNKLDGEIATEQD